MLAEPFQITRIEFGRRPFALNRHRRSSSSCKHEINFMAALVTPVEDIPYLQTALNLVQDIMLPKQPHVFPAELSPPAVIADESRIKTVNFRRGNNLSGLAGAEWPYKMHHVSCFESGQVIRDGCPADLTGRCKACCLKYAAALSHQQLEKTLEGVTALQMKKLLDVFCPIAIDPILKITLRHGCGQMKRRQPPKEKPFLKIRQPEVHKILRQHGRQP